MKQTIRFSNENGKVMIDLTFIAYVFQSAACGYTLKIHSLGEDQTLPICRLGLGFMLSEKEKKKTKKKKKKKKTDCCVGIVDNRPVLKKIRHT